MRVLKHVDQESLVWADPAAFKKGLPDGVRCLFVTESDDAEVPTAPKGCVWEGEWVEADVILVRLVREHVRRLE